MKKDITRAIIDATVDRGLRDIYEDPRRSIRKLADLGRQFQKFRFMQDLYAIIQDLLRNDDSPYYTAVEHLLQYTDRKKLKDFGINLGYNSFTKGAKIIRKNAENNTMNIPWSIIIKMDSSVKYGITPRDLIDLIAQGRKLGIYSYFILLSGNNDYLEDLIKVFITYDDCAFMLFLPDSEINQSVSEYIEACSNVIYFLPIFADSCGSNVVLLKHFKAWYGLYGTYNDSTYKELLQTDTPWDYLIHDSAFMIALSDDGNTSEATREKVASSIKKQRMEPIAPLFQFDLYGDYMAIQKLIGGNPCFLLILEDGSLRTLNGTVKTTEGLPDLKEAFKLYL